MKNLTLFQKLGSLVLALAASCGGPRYEQRAAPRLAAAVIERGQTVYFGRVFPLGASDPLFVYERRVEETDGASVSTHITRDLSGTIVLADSATHAADYALADYTLHANQLGQTGRIRVDGDQVSFHLVDGDRERSRVERRQGPVVVGPTLIGYIFRNLDGLRAGQVLPVRFAVLDRLETIGFELEAIDPRPGQPETTVRMKASSLLLSRVIKPIVFTFETATGKLVRLQGRVPPRVRAGDRWGDLDARVEYRFVAAAYH